MVGAIGFEPTTPCAQGRCATRLRYAPTAAQIQQIRKDLPRSNHDTGITQQAFVTAALRQKLRTASSPINTRSHISASIEICLAPPRKEAANRLQSSRICSQPWESSQDFASCSCYCPPIQKGWWLEKFRKSLIFPIRLFHITWTSSETKDLSRYSVKVPSSDTRQIPRHFNNCSGSSTRNVARATRRSNPNRLWNVAS